MINMTVTNPNLLMEPVNPMDRIANPLERLVELNQNNAVVKNIELCILTIILTIVVGLVMYSL